MKNILLKDLLPENAVVNVPHPLQANNTELNEQKLIDVLNNNCALALDKYKNRQQFFRGQKTTNDFLILDPSHAKRTSLSGNNLYNLYMDTSPHWRGFPRRSWSIIFSTADWIAASYGLNDDPDQVYVLLPMGDPMVTVSSTGDFLYAPFKLSKNQITVGDFSVCLEKFLNANGQIIKQTERDEHVFIKAKEEAFKAVNEYNLRNGQLPHPTTKDINLTGVHDDDKELLMQVYNNVIDVMYNNKSSNLNDTFYNIMKPSNVKTTCIPFSKLTSHNLLYECWTEGKGVLVKRNLLKHLIHIGKI